MQSDTRSTRTLLYTIYLIYFFCGLTQCFEGVFLPEFKEYFSLNYQQQMYTMFTKNIPFVLAVVIGVYVRQIGFKNCMTLAMLLFAAGTLLLVPGLQTHRYELVLLGFFLIGIGFNFELVAGNPLLSALGPASGSSSRLNLGNALGAVAQIIAPATLTFIIPATVITVQGKLPYMYTLFIVLGVGLILIALLTQLNRNPGDITGAFEAKSTLSLGGGSAGRIWQHPHLMQGFVTIFLILGFEAGLFGLYRNFLEDPSIAGLTAHESQRMFTLYFALFAVGRLAASWIQKRMLPATHLAYCAFAAMICLAGAILTKGWMAVAAVTALGFFVSIFFPTLYAIAIEGMGSLTGQASGLLTMGFVGCAILPVLQGRLADTVGLQRSYAIGFVAYLFTAFYALRSRNRSVAS
jgi:FHS family L-fucose permease-like MFS transporter